MAERDKVARSSKYAHCESRSHQVRVTRVEAEGGFAPHGGRGLAHVRLLVLREPRAAVEGFATLVTLVRLLSGVDSLMYDQV